ncbi:Protein translocase subunit [Frankliniella fusca]|uniref:Protein translocase subunit n=1 Tax=Frankliniella fusca TaxID=407009 RepID=A0AAE1GU73_9NEOP|nr:Protein translocase subunit [Frankliniella fusca]
MKIKGDRTSKCFSDRGSQTYEPCQGPDNVNGPAQPQPPPMIVKPGQLPVRRARPSYSKGCRVTRVYRMFGLRHGVMMIAIHDLLWSSFIVFLLVLAAAHSREVSCIVEGDMKVHAAEHEAAEQAENMAGLGLGLGGLADQENRSSYYMQYVQLAYEQARTMMAHDNDDHADGVRHLHGGDRHDRVHDANVRQLMMPWLSLRLIEVLICVFGSMIVVLVWARGIMLVKIGVFVVGINCIVAYHWRVAYSLHEWLCRQERVGRGGVHHTTRATAQMYVPCHCLGPLGLGTAAAPTPHPPACAHFMRDLDGRTVWRSIVNYHLAAGPPAAAEHGCAPAGGDLAKMISAATNLTEGMAAAGEQTDLLTGGGFGSSHLSATTPPAVMVGAGAGAGAGAEGEGEAEAGEGPRETSTMTK